MSRPSHKRRARRRKCRHCHELYTPDPRNRYHQKYCSRLECRQASKKASQQRWLSSEKGQGYFSGSANVAHVQKWRAAHPGYWKMGATLKTDALQDFMSQEVADIQEDTSILNAAALQDICSVQPALLIGLIASLTGSTLQDDIAQTTRRFIISGQDILGCVPEKLTPKGGCRHG